MLRKAPALVALLGLLLGGPSWPGWALLIITGIGAWALWHRNALAWLLMIPIGNFHFWVHAWPTPDDITRFVGWTGGVQVKVLGTHVAEVERLEAQDQWIPVTGRLGVLPVLRVPWGTRMTFKGRIVIPPDTGFLDWRAYLRGEGAAAMLIPTMRVKLEPPTHALARLRQAIEHQVQTQIQDPSAQALVRALILGDRTRLGSDIQEAFRRTGTFHLLALSGLHVGLVFSLLLLFFQILRFPYRLRWILGVLGLLGYLGLIGPRPSLVRGVLFVTTFVLAFLAERPRVPLNALGVAGLISLFLFPFWRWSLGFQLSYLATLGILLWVPVFPRFRSRFLHGMVSAFLVSVVAQAFVAPLLLQAFHGLSLAAPLLNVPLITLTWLLLAETFLALLIAPISSLLAMPFWALTEGIARVILWITRNVARWPGVYFEIGPVPGTLITVLLLCVIGGSVVFLLGYSRTRPIDPWTTL